MAIAQSSDTIKQRANKDDLIIFIDSNIVNVDISRSITDSWYI
jgi:hypothetical protein